tara:strand:+ start:12307 stop:12957 length:651 start_codon:yes stop_codon:yes gene_type:complete
MSGDKSGSTTDDAYSNQQVGQGSKVNKAGQNTRIDSGGNRVNFNTGPAEVQRIPNYTKILPNGIVVEDYSRPFQGQVNLSSRGTPEVVDLSTQREPFTPASVTTPTVSGGLYDALAVDVMPDVNIPDVNDLSARERSLMNAINMNQAVTPEQARDQALGVGQFGDGRIGIGGGFSVGKVPGGFGIQFDKTYAKGGSVTSGIGSLGLPQAMFKSTKI